MLSQKILYLVLCTVASLLDFAIVSWSLSISQGSRLDAGNRSSLPIDSGSFTMNEHSPPEIICDAVEYGYGGRDLDVKSCMDAYFTFADFPDGDLAIGERGQHHTLDIALPFRLISGKYHHGRCSQMDCLYKCMYQVMETVFSTWSRLEMCPLQRQQA